MLTFVHLIKLQNTNYVTMKYAFKFYFEDSEACFCSPVVTDAKSMAGRHSKRIILLEGKRLVNEAIQTQQDLKSVFFTHTDVLQGLPVDLLAAQGVELYRVNPNHMKVWSDTVTPQGIMGKFDCLQKYKYPTFQLQSYIVYLINFFSLDFL